MTKYSENQEKSPRIIGKTQIKRGTDLILELPEDCGFSIGDQISIETDGERLVLKKFVEIEVDLDQDVLFELMMMAHKKNITLNELANQIIKEYLESTGS